jgi:short-subunit dehydrogenase
MARTALITGASSGLGAEYARQLAARGTDLVLVSPERDELAELAAQLGASFGVEVDVLVADLLVGRECAQVVRRLTDPARPIDMLVNSAGFGLHLHFDRNDIDDEARHLALLVEVPMRLMHAALGPMLQRGSGRIVNVASVAGFIPRSTYGACKGWVISFSRWANGRYARRGVTVTAVCPGFTHTSFHERMGLQPGQEGVADWMWLDARAVVAESLRDIARGKAVSVPSLRYRAIVAVTRVVPTRLLSRAGVRRR